MNEGLNLKLICYVLPAIGFIVIYAQWAIGLVNNQNIFPKTVYKLSFIFRFPN